MSTEQTVVEKTEDVIVNRLDSILDELEDPDMEEPAEESAETEEAPAEEAAKSAVVEEPPAAEVPAEKEPEVDIAAELQSTIQTQNRQIKELQAKLSAHDKRIREAGLIPEDEIAAEEDFAAKQEARIGQLEMLAVSTRMMASYKDLDDVVTNTRFNDTVNALTQAVAKQAGISPEEAYQRVDAHIWGMSNPWTYVYDLIKSSHKDFSTPAPAPAPPSTSQREMKAVDVPTTLASMQGGESVKSGWTADKIDALPEDKLNSVPKDIYERYLRGELD